MKRLEYNDVKFIQQSIDEKRILKCVFYEHFFFDIRPKINYSVEKGVLIVDDKYEKKIRKMVENGIRNDLRSMRTEFTDAGYPDKKVYKKAVFVDRGSGIGLIGNVGFGIVDRNTNVIEVKPITGCNLKCIYCSVDEDKRSVDFVVEPDYLVDELGKLIEMKDCEDIDIHIGGQGEPLRYKYLKYFVSKISKNKHVRNISIDTNGLLLNTEMAEQLIDAGLTQINLSINSLNDTNASRIAGCTRKIDANWIKDLSKMSVKLVLAPVLMKGINDSDIEEIVEFCAVNGIICGIQNYLYYNGGRNPAKEIKWEDFRGLLHSWEDKYDIRLLFSEGDFNIHKTIALAKPFKKGDIVSAYVVSFGQFNDEWILSAQGRIISARGNFSVGRSYKVRIIRDKHNIFIGEKVSR
ncbi:radical SAM protein [Candidatus Woesearchaeota archaeon]|nr:radical SAM protein [Candidatus Woesearchaeota archaeon]